jgi:hypothetical protein
VVQFLELGVQDVTPALERVGREVCVDPSRSVDRPVAAPGTTAAEVSAGLITTSTQPISSVPAPAATDSNMACIAGDGVWCTISSRRMCLQHSASQRAGNYALRGWRGMKRTIP